MHLRKKMKEKPPPKYFEVEPPSGVLLPGQTLDIRVKFMPSEEVQCHVYMYIKYVLQNWFSFRI
jgi:hydrocephalus-inducing protein